MSSEEVPPNVDLYHIFQASSLGTALQDTLYTLQAEGKLDDREVEDVQFVFERAMAKQFHEFSKSENKIDLYLEGKLEMYRYCDNVWTLCLEDATFSSKEGTPLITSQDLRIVACEIPNSGPKRKN